MNIGAAAVGISSLLNLLGNSKNDRPSPADVFAPQGESPANSSTSGGQALPAPANGGISFDMMLALQSISQQREERASAPATADAPGRSDAVQAFLDESQKTPMERMREQILELLGLTEDDLNNMTTEDRRAAEAKIAELVKEKLRQGITGESASGEAQGVGQFMVEVAPRGHVPFCVQKGTCPPHKAP